MATKDIWRLKKTVVLVGMMGAGKTAVGKALAGLLHVPFVDSDVEIEAAANMTIKEIFARDGEAFFRDRESEVIERLLDRECAILSAGGGAFLAQRNRDIIHAKGVSVWLNADLKLLWDRVKNKDTRPLLRTADPYATLEALFEDRLPFYKQAELSVAAQSNYSIDEMAQAVCAALAQRDDVLEKVHA